MKCSKCKKEKDETEFKAKNDRIVKQCSACRELCKKWRAKNKERVKLYNNFTIETTKKSKIKVIYAKLKDDEKWIKYKNQRQAALQLGVHASKINKGIKGKLSQTGGYEFKIVEEDYENKNLNWETIKKENDITNNVKGVPSQHRILHETINEIVGKKCCSCKELKELTSYNYSKSHGYKLRNDYKDCLISWRKKKIKKLCRKQLIHKRKQKKTEQKYKI